jgi:chromatin assembly factor 1 subunit B
MKVKTVLISWHGREPVYSIDFHSSGRVATGGADNCVNVRSYSRAWRPAPCSQILTTTRRHDMDQIWKAVVGADGDVQVEFLANLTRHQKAVNAVRFSPNGSFTHPPPSSSCGAVLSAPCLTKGVSLLLQESTWLRQAMVHHHLACVGCLRCLVRSRNARTTCGLTLRALSQTAR